MLLVLVRPGEIINVKIFFGRPVFVVDEDASKFSSAKAVAMRESDVINVIVIIAKSSLNSSYLSLSLHKLTKNSEQLARQTKPNFANNFGNFSRLLEKRRRKKSVSISLLTSGAEGDCR